MTKFIFPTPSGYKIIIEAETKEKAEQILNELNEEPKAKSKVFN